MTNPKTNEAVSRVQFGSRRNFFPVVSQIGHYIALVRANNIGATCFPQFGK